MLPAHSEFYVLSGFRQFFVMHIDGEGRHKYFSRCVVMLLQPKPPDLLMQPAGRKPVARQVGGVLLVVRPGVRWDDAQSGGAAAAVRS